MKTITLTLNDADADTLQNILAAATVSELISPKWSAVLHQVYHDIRRARIQPPQELSAASITTDEVQGLKQVVEFLKDQVGKSHQGYYAPPGWAGEQVNNLLIKLLAQVKS
jgi:hypothetical protein